jgi:hypothetical protein
LRRAEKREIEGGFMAYLDDDTFDNDFDDNFNADDFNDDEEFGGIKPKKPVYKTVGTKPTSNRIILVKPVPKPKIFGQKVSQLRQSTNVEDRREALSSGMNSVTLEGYLTWNTFFHLSANVGSNIKNALQSRGFNCYGVSFSNRDYENSQYNFRVVLLVLERYSSQDIKGSFTEALEKTVSLPNSVRVRYFAYNNRR